MKNIRKIVASLAGVVLLIAAAGVAGVSFWTFGQIKEAAEARKHARIVLMSADELLSALKDAETGQRGYLLTGDEVFLKPYLAVRDNIGDQLVKLRQTTSNGAAYKYLDAMAPLIVAKLAELAHVIELRRNHDMTAVLAAVNSGQGKRLMDSIRAEMSSFIQLEEGALAQHEVEYQSNMRNLFIIIVAASLLMLLFALSFAYLIYRETQHRLLAAIKISDDAAREYAESIINTIREPLIALNRDLRVVSVSRSFYEFFKVKPEETMGQLIYALGNRQWDIPKLRELLETILPQNTTFDNYEVEHEFATIGRRIMLLNARQIERGMGKERIILLAIEDITEKKKLERGVAQARDAAEAANKELEAFSYSVSHDLRAPLRHVSGYVELLAKHFKSELSEKGVHYLDSIADSAHQMGKLIDDLLQFARTGRAEMHRSLLEMNGIVQEVVESVVKDNPDRAIEWVVRELPPVYGDDAMLRLVWINLLSNAAKFTQTREKAMIEIGARAETKEVIFFVRDNGVGFDMRYAQKLFGVFQRLHPTEEFEGTGIGLANVRRIIVRHGGRTWAEAELDKGATFYFSIPRN
jgi:PAS domain S-box-containing protein